MCLPAFLKRIEQRTSFSYSSFIPSLYSTRGLLLPKSTTKGCMKKVWESGRRTCVGADLSCPPPIDRPAGMADQSAVGTINRPLQFTYTFFIHPQRSLSLTSQSTCHTV